MDDMIALLAEIRDLLIEMNDKLDAISGSGLNNLDDVCNKIDDLKGTGIYNSISDVCDKLDSLDTTIMLK